MADKSRAYRDPPRPPGSWPLIAAFANDHHGVIETEQLRAFGVDKHAVARRIANAQLHALYPGVYAVGHRSITPRGRLFAAVVACGPKAALSHRSAGYLWDVRAAPARIEVTIPHGARRPKGIKTYESRILDERDVTEIDGIRVTSLARTLLDLAAVLPLRDLARAIDRAERLELLDLRAIDEVLSRARGRKGARALRAAIAAWRPRFTRQELEDRFQDLVEASGVPSPQTNVLVDGERHTHEVDAYWPEFNLVVELDGFAHHRTRMDLERDAAKTADLELAGKRVMRLSWDEVTVHASRTLRRLQAVRR